MSVRRESFRGARSNGFVDTLKSLALWTGILTGCFLFGWLVVSPLINVATGRGSTTSSAPPPTTHAAVNPMPSPPSRETPAVQNPFERRTERRATRDEKPDIQLDPEKNKDEIQTADPVERTSESRRDRRGSRARDESAATQPAADSTDPSTPTDESASADPVNHDSAASEEPRTSRRREPRSGQEPSSQERRSRRRGRTNDSAPQPADQGAGVQRGESIDN